MIRGQKMIRKAERKDIDEIVRIYDAILEQEERGEIIVGWQRRISHRL
ncbi:MAG: hypothetical protein ACLSFO_00920 [Anaerovoracaceae bacterium]